MKIIITGGTKGIGRAIADKFAKENFDIAVCSRTQTDLEDLKTELTKLNPNIKLLTQVCNMKNKSEVLAFADLIKKEWGDFDVLINNAGVFLPGAIAEEEDGNLELMMETNLYSAYYFTRALLPTLVKKGKGHIFNMCSIASKIAYPNGGSYSISKFALLGFSKVLREELKEKGIKVTSILPGATWSNSWAGVDLPQERLMEANDIALSVWNAYSLSPSAVVEEIILRPQLGDL